MHNYNMRTTRGRGRSYPPGKSSSKGSDCSGGKPFATWRTISKISNAMTLRAVPVAPLNKYPTATAIWERTNLANREENILPTRPRATLILTKGADHVIETVALRRL